MTDTQPGATPQDPYREQLKRALLAIKKMQAKLDAEENRAVEPLAIVGMGCRFPGGAQDPDAYWRLLQDGVDAITEIPGDRWDVDAYYDPDPQALGKSATRWGGFMDQIDRFDPQFFGISPREAIVLDPQQRVFLEVVWEALEHAGIAPDRLQDAPVGVFVGVCNTDYMRRTLDTIDDERIDAYLISGNTLNAIAGRTSYVLGLQGPSVALDTACSSSLVAIHLACQSLRAGDCDVALAGGVNVLISPEVYICESRWGMMAPDGRCKAFDASADGFVRSEGCGVIVLKRLRDAVAEGDPILAVIRSTTVNQDGASGGLTVPNGLAQQALMRKALAQARLEPGDIGFIEAHGTGTSLGDPIELEAIHAVYDRGRAPGTPLYVGSVKSNIGHLESAAGIAGLIKVVLAMQHNEIPPNLHFNTPTPHVAWDAWGIEVPTQPVPWAGEAGTRRAAVSSFGFSGTNAHVILEEAPAAAAVAAVEHERPLHQLCLSARSEASLRTLAARYAGYLGAHPDVSLGDLCYTARTGRAHFSHRLAVVGASAEELRDALRAAAEGRSVPGLRVGQIGRMAGPRVAFLFTGQGAQHPGMGRSLYRSEPVFRAALDRCDALLRPHLGLSILDVLFPGPDADPNRIHQTAFTQPALFALEYALYELWTAWGLKAGAVAGHSVGEYVAACVAGVFSLEDGLKLIAARGRLMQQLPEGGAMAAVFAEEARVREAIEAVGEGVSIAAVNGPANVVVSGRAEAVADVSARFEGQGVQVKPLKVSHAFHSGLMDPMLDAFERVAGEVTYHRPRLRLVSNVSGAVLSAEEVGQAAYWRRHVRAAVRFADGMRTLHDLGYTTFVELGPHPVLLGMGRESLPDASADWLPSLRRDRDDHAQLFETLSALYLRNAALDWAAVDTGFPRRLLRLPTYPFMRERYWIEDEKPAPRRPVTTDEHPLLGRRLASPVHTHRAYEATFDAHWPPLVQDHRIYDTVLMPGTGFVEMARAAGAAHFDVADVAVCDLVVHAALMLPDDPVTVQLILIPDGADRAAVQIYSRSAAEPSDEAWVRHVTARVERAQTTLGGDVDPDALQARCDEAVDVDAFYASLRDQGVRFGPRFVTLDRLYRGTGEALGRVVLPEAARAEARAFHMHPALLDGCQHVVAAAQGSEEEGLFLPLSMERYAGVDRLEGPLWSHVRVRPRSDRDGAGRGETFTVDIDLYDEAGRPVGRMDGLNLKRAPREALLASGTASLRGATYEIRWHLREPEAAEPDPAGVRRLVIADSGGLAQALAERLEADGDTVDVLDPASGLSEDRFRDALAIGHGYAHIVDLRGLDATPGGDLPGAVLDATDRTLRVARVLATTPAPQPRYWVITRGAAAVGDEAPDLTNAPLQGLVRVIDREQPGLRCTHVDLDPSGFSTDADVLAREIRQGDDEREVAYRAQARHVPRLQPVQPPEVHGPDQPPVQLVSTQRGLLENLVYRPRPRVSPGAGEVEIQVRATGLNFRDVLNAMGMYPGDPGPLGDECAGVVTAVGEGVTAFRAGQAVFGMVPGAGGFSTYVIGQADLLVAKPEALTFEEAATVPITFLTAYYALHELAAIRPGERVLIHAAAGGVGLAAVQLALRAGAEVYGTAGSPEKRALLHTLGVQHVFNSRTLDFAGEIMAATGGEGIDVVLNSLAGEFIEKSMSVLRAGGRFLEIGKTGIWTAEQVAAYNPELTYHVIYLGDVSADDPATIQAMYQPLLEGFEDGSLRPLPRTVFPAEDAVEAFRYMAQARHVGKVVLANTGARAVAAAGLRPDATYLITGGLGGLGLRVATWMADEGATSLVLMGRRAPNGPAADAIAALEARGVRVTVAAGDVSKAADVEAVLALLRTGGPPLRGVIHAAGVLDDAPLHGQDRDRIGRVLAPKVAGAWHLHRLTRADDLDFFVVFSAGAALVGNPGQAGYAAANAFLDALARDRQAAFLPGLSINWGVWGEVGMAASTGEAGLRRMAAQGFDTIAPDQGVRALHDALQGSQAHIAVLPVRWDRFRDQLADGSLSLVRGLTGAAAGGAQAADTEAIRERLEEATTAAQRKKIMRAFVQRTAAGVLGLDAETRFDLGQPLNELGLDSLMAVELRNALSQATNVTLPTTLLFDYPTIGTLADHLVERLVPEAPDAPQAAAPEPARPDASRPGASEADGGADDLDALTDEEAEALLLEELSNLKKNS